MPTQGVVIVTDRTQNNTCLSALEDRISHPLDEWEKVSLGDFTESARLYLAQGIAAGLDDLMAGRVTQMTGAALDARLERFRKRSLSPEPDV